MSGTNEDDPAKPRKHPKWYEWPPIRRASLWLGLDHAHAPHWVIAILTAALVVFAYRAWDESIQGTTELRRQANYSQAQLTELRSEQRPWIGMGFVGYPPDGPFQLQFISNGKSPAIDVAIFAKVVPGAFSDPPQLPSARCTTDCKMDGIVMLPGIPFQMVLLREQASTNPISFRDISAWIIGRADYKDAQGGAHATGVCLFHSPVTHDLVACPMPNSNYAY